MYLFISFCFYCGGAEIKDTNTDYTLLSYQLPDELHKSETGPYRDLYALSYLIYNTWLSHLVCSDSYGGYQALSNHFC